MAASQANIVSSLSEECVLNDVRCRNAIDRSQDTWGMGIHPVAVVENKMKKKAVVTRCAAAAQ